VQHDSSQNRPNLSLYDDIAIGWSREMLLRQSGYEVASERGDAYRTIGSPDPLICGIVPASR
jgi:hypothetical protein